MSKQRASSEKNLQGEKKSRPGENSQRLRNEPTGSWHRFGSKWNMSSQEGNAVASSRMCCAIPGTACRMQSWKQPVDCTTFETRTQSGGPKPNENLIPDKV